jgi:hypothetical protein
MQAAVVVGNILCDGNFLLKVDVLHMVQQCNAGCKWPLKSFSAGDKPHAPCRLLIIAVMMASLRSASTAEAPPELSKPILPIYQFITW